MSGGLSDESAPSGGLAFRIREEISIWDGKCASYTKDLKRMELNGTATARAIENMRKSLDTAKRTRDDLKTLLATMSATLCD